jgi:Family of unknown function (DUF6527)
VKLSELNPRWLDLDVFIFECPHCRKIHLSCKRVKMTIGRQVDLFEQVFGEGAAGENVVPSNKDVAWRISGDFDSMTITPSIDASGSGHWHGSITNGEIVGGQQMAKGTP